jgi:hypothetical protein
MTGRAIAALAWFIGALAGSTALMSGLSLSGWFAIPCLAVMVIPTVALLAPIMI